PVTAARYPADRRPLRPAAVAAGRRAPPPWSISRVRKVSGECRSKFAQSTRTTSTRIEHRGRERTTSEPAVLGSQHEVHRYLRAVEKTVVGFCWSWPPENGRSWPPEDGR